MTPTKIEFRWLNSEELTVLAPTIEANGWPALNPELGTALAAFDGEYLIGFVAMQCVPHVEPLWIDPNYRGQRIAEALVAQMVDFLYSVRAPIAYLIANNAHSEILAKSYKMTRLEHPVYFKRGE